MIGRLMNKMVRHKTDTMHSRRIPQIDRGKHGLQELVLVHRVRALHVVLPLGERHRERAGVHERRDQRLGHANVQLNVLLARHVLRDRVAVARLPVEQQQHDNVGFALETPGGTDEHGGNT